MCKWTILFWERSHSFKILNIRLWTGWSDRSLQIDQLNLMNEQLKFIKTSGKITHHSRWVYGVYTSDDWRKSERCQHVNGWIRKHEDLNQLSQEISPDTAMEAKDSDKANVVDFRAPNMFQNIPLSRIIIFCLLPRSKSLLHASTPSFVSISVDYHLEFA